MPLTFRYLLYVSDKFLAYLCQVILKLKLLGPEASNVMNIFSLLNSTNHSHIFRHAHPFRLVQVLHVVDVDVAQQDEGLDVVRVVVHQVMQEGRCLKWAAGVAQQ